MTPRERLQKVLNHEQVDKLCVDFGAGFQTGIGVCAVDRLRKAVLGENDYQVKVSETFQMLGEIDLPLRNALGIDITGVSPPTDFFGIRQRGWKPFTMPSDGTEVLVPGNFNYTVNNFGDFLMYPQGDTTLRPCAMMPQSSFCWEILNSQESVDFENLDYMDNCQEFSEFSDEDLAYYKSKIDWIYDNTDSGIFLSIPGLSIGDTDHLAGTWMKNPKGIRNVDSWYKALASHRDLVHEIFKYQCEVGLKNIERMAQEVGDKVQVLYVSGTDFATNDGLFISRNVYKELFAPYYKAINDKVHELTNWKTFIHSCGNIRELLPDIIESGFDIINPLEYGCDDMQPAALIKEYGNDLVFWGGGIDSRDLLLNGSEIDVYDEVRRQIDIYSQNSGYVFNSVNNILNNTPIQNILAMFKAVDNYR